MKPQWPYGVKYEIFVLAFADGNGDGKGDLRGLTSKLDYLQDLGVNGIWLMPIMPSPSYHKYDVTDYKSIHPDYGTLDDFKVLVEEAHRRDIRILVDFVLNHTSKLHPWFLSAREGTQSPYRDYFIWADRDSIKNEIAKKTITLDSDNMTQWHEVNNDSLAEHYYGFFSSHMPDLNFDNHQVREEFVDIARFWLEEMNVDGFRFDAAKHIYPDDRAADSHAFWKWYRDELRKIKPDVYLVGEVYSMDSTEVAPYTAGLPSLFNFGMAQAIIKSLQNGRDDGLIRRYQNQMELYASVNTEFLDAPILSNHDQNRIMSQVSNDPGKATVAASILLTLPGTPYIYYGEELGMRGVKPDEYIREPFLWGDTSVETHWVEPRHSTSATVNSLLEQQNNPGSLFHHYKKLINFRNENKALTLGGIERIDELPVEVVGFRRISGDESVTVFHNISYREITLRLGDKTLTKVDFMTSESVKFDNLTLVLPPYSSVIGK